MSQIMDRMKRYEKAYNIYLPPRMPVLVRCDGSAFHSYTKGCKKPFDEGIINGMAECAKALCDKVAGCKFAYVQSDEISLLIVYYQLFNSQPWFDNKLLKIVSVTAGTASGVMTAESPKIFGKTKVACFDSRAWVQPESDVTNYFIARQQDWHRNSIQMLAQSLYSHKQLQGKKNTDLQEMIYEANQNWNDLPIYLKRGQCIIKGDSGWVVDREIPIFTQNRDYIEKYLKVQE